MFLRVFGAVIAALMVFGSVQALEIGGTEGAGGSSGYIGSSDGDYCAKKAGYTDCSAYGNAKAQGYTLTAADAGLVGDRRADIGQRLWFNQFRRDEL